MVKAPITPPLLLLCIALCAAACGPVEIAEEADDAMPAAVALDAAGLAAADLERGEILSLACQACHPFEPDIEAEIGPNLFGVFGRRAAADPNFEYSEALRAVGVTWDAENLNEWLLDPAGFVPGSAMVFAGYSDPADRRDLIAYLLARLNPERAAR